jgi:hypothetical protein
VKYSFTRTVARADITVGVLVIIAGAVLAIAAVYFVPQAPAWDRLARSPHELLARVAGAIVILGVGVLVGTAFIVSGQLLLVFLDMRARLERIDRRLRDWEATKQSDASPLVERLRPQ